MTIIRVEVTMNKQYLGLFKNDIRNGICMIIYSNEWIRFHGMK